MRAIPATSHPQAPLAAALLLALGLAPAAGMAATCEDTLRSMVGSASSGDTVDLTTFALSCSNVTLTQGEIGVGVDNLTINGPPNGALTLSGNKSGRVFSHSGSGMLTLANLNLQDGWLITTSARGGSVYSKGSIALDHVHVSDCLTVATGPFASAGGAVAAGQRISLTDSIVSGNTAFADPANGVAVGGGLAAFNYARANLPSVVAVRSSISGNRANSYGAAGGGIFAEDGIMLDSSTVDGNSSVSPQTVGPANHGGGIAVATGFASPVSLVVNSTISGNSTSGKAGGAYFGVQTQILNSTIAFNSAASCGGAAVRPPSGTLSVYSSIIAKNASVSGNADLCTAGSIIGSNDLIIDADLTPPATLAFDPQLSPLAYHGGPTRVHAINPASPAVDAGNNPDAAPDDQRGTGFDRVIGTAPDIGAYERQLVDDEIFYSGFD